MALLQGQMLHFRQQAGAEIFTAKSVIHRHAFNDVSRQTRAAHQPVIRQRFNHQADIAVHPQPTVCQQITHLAHTLWMFQHLADPKIDNRLCGHCSAHHPLQRRRQRPLRRIHNHVAEMADMLDFHLNPVSRVHK